MGKYIFPVAIILLNIGAAVMYAVAYDMRKAIYFIAAAVEKYNTEKRWKGGYVLKRFEQK